MLLTMGRHLMGAREIEDRLGVSRQRVYQLTSRADFPEPYDELATGRVWRIEDIERWISDHRPELHDTEPDTSSPPSRKGHRIAMRATDKPPTRKNGS
jgi:prophage regulatory protein